MPCCNSKDDIPAFVAPLRTPTQNQEVRAVWVNCRTPEQPLDRKNCDRFTALCVLNYCSDALNAAMDNFRHLDYMLCLSHSRTGLPYSHSPQLRHANWKYHEMHSGRHGAPSTAARARTAAVIVDTHEHGLLRTLVFAAGLVSINLKGGCESM